MEIIHILTSINDIREVQQELQAIVEESPICLLTKIPQKKGDRVTSIPGDTTYSKNFL